MQSKLTAAINNIYTIAKYCKNIKNNKAFINRLANNNCLTPDVIAATINMFYNVKN